MTYSPQSANRLAWLGNSLGTQQLLAFALQHLGRQLKLLVRLARGVVAATGVGSQKSEVGSTPNSQPSTLRSEQPSFSVLLLHGQNDEVLPLAQAEGVAARLRTNGVPVELKVLLGEGNGLGGNRLLVFRVVTEQCLTRLKGPDAGSNYRSILSWQGQATPLWLFWTPAFV